MTSHWKVSLGSNYESKNLQGDKETVNNSFEEAQERMKDIINKIRTALGQTNILALKLWMLHPEMNWKLQDLKKQIDQNKQNMSREFSCDILWKIKGLFNEYWDSRERDILNSWLTECLIKLPQLHTEIKDIKDSMDVIESIDADIWDSIIDFASSLDLLKWANETTNSGIKRWSSIKPLGI